jgi:NtrC-family two-component system response regulator AlgB
MNDPKSPVPPLNVLVVDDEANIRKTLAVCLESKGHHVTVVGRSRDALDQAAVRPFDLAFVDLRLGTEAGMDLVPRLLAGRPGLKVVVITAHASVETAVEAVRRGASDYLAKPFTPAQVLLITRKMGELRDLERRIESLEREKAGLSGETPRAAARPVPTAGAALKPGDPVTLARIEEEHIRKVLASAASIEEAAGILGIDQATLWRRRKQYGID